jgi:hypothetical protein
MSSHDRAARTNEHGMVDSMADRRGRLCDVVCDKGPGSDLAVASRRGQHRDLRLAADCVDTSRTGPALSKIAVKFDAQTLVVPVIRSVGRSQKKPLTAARESVIYRYDNVSRVVCASTRGGLR